MWACACIASGGNDDNSQEQQRKNKSPTPKKQQQQPSLYPFASPLLTPRLCNSCHLIYVLFISTHKTRTQFTPNEITFMVKASSSPEDCASVDAQLKRFYRLWCLKESIVNALDISSGFDLKSIEFTIQDEEETEKVKNCPLLCFCFYALIRLCLCLIPSCLDMSMLHLALN